MTQQTNGQIAQLLKDDWTTPETIVFRLEHDTTAFTDNYFPAGNFRVEYDTNPVVAHSQGGAAGFRLEVDADPVVADTSDIYQAFVDIHVFDFMA
ncbi:MAG: hypothetical protein ACFB03_19760 [Paracoccaceae bacterium]